MKILVGLIIEIFASVCLLSSIIIMFIHCIRSAVVAEQQKQLPQLQHLCNTMYQPTSAKYYINVGDYVLLASRLPIAVPLLHTTDSLCC